MSFHLKVVTPERLFFDDVVESVVVRAVDGDIGIRGGHIPLAIAISPGVMRIRQDGKVKSASCTGGFMVVNKDHTVVVADAAEWPEEIDVRRAREARERAKRSLKKGKNINIVRVQASLMRANVRLRLANTYRGRKK